MPDFCGMKTKVGNSPADHADKGADKIADFVFRLFIDIARKRTWYNFCEHYLRIYLRLICVICGRFFLNYHIAKSLVSVFKSNLI